jgi:anion-transporting  ArsA/GET3 family ATPase
VTDGSDGKWAVVDDLLRRHSVIVVTGNGGVGKTTVSAALGLRAATEHDRRVLVVTVDPARRLADSLGVNGLPGEAVLVPVGRGDGRLWVLMVEMSQAWDGLVRRCAPDASVAGELLGNELYRALTTRFVASHDYVALDHLGLLEGETYDMIVVDTPPGEHTDDIFAAPQRLRQFFDSRLLRWLTAGVGSGFSRVAARPFLALAERILGGDFLTRISEFFALFARLRPGLLARIETVERLLESDRSAVVEVWAADGVRPQQRAKDRSDVVIINRVLPATTIEIETRPNQRRQLDLQSSVGAADLHHIDSEEMRKAVGSLLVGSGAISLSIPEDAAVALVARTAGGVNDLDDLQTMIDEAIALGPIIDQV